MDYDAQPLAWFALKRSSKYHIPASPSSSDSSIMACLTFRCFLAVSMFFALDFCLAFQAVTPPSATTSVRNTPLLMAKKKRRRKRKESPSSQDSSSSSVGGDDLPDFDIQDDDDDEPEVSMKAPTLRKPINPDEITENMMGTQKPLGSVKDLISDRSLESSFQFEEPDNPLPDLKDLVTPQPGKKKARQEARRAAAIAQEEEESSIVDSVSDALGSLPFLKSDRESSSLKLVENATWLGIFLLIAWEVYINSPFFERAAPLSPIVYDFFM